MGLIERLHGYRMSALEHFVPERMFSTSKKPLYGISAVRALETAAKEGQVIWTITQENLDHALTAILIDQDVQNEIRNSVSQGKVAVVHERNLDIEGWVGAGYILTDPITGAGAYKLSGGYNGGQTEAPEKSGMDLSSTIMASPAAIISTQPNSSLIDKATFFGFIECQLDTVLASIAIVLAIAVIALLFKRLLAAAIAIPQLGIKVSTLIAGVTASAFAVAGVENADEAAGQNCKVGDCTVEEHRELEDKKDENCSQGFRCTHGMSESELARRSLIALACADARKEIMDRCFKGGDEGHQKAYNSALEAHENCVSILSGL